MQPIHHDCREILIAIKTSWKDSIGKGHIQRMSTLLWFLNMKDKVRAFIVSDSIPDFMQPKLSKYIIPDMNFKPDLIIRDMRDSSVREIHELQRTGRVLVIDDNGKGRNEADFTIDLLPNPDTIVNNTDLRKNFFVYGYNFLTTLSGLSGKKIIKNIDFAIYPGSADPEYIEFLLSLIPDNSSYAVLNGGKTFLHDGKKQNQVNLSYAEIILSSKIIISHFGILLYEGHLAGCRLITINPSPYHSKLSDMETSNLDLVNLGEHSVLNTDEAANTILSVLKESPAREIKADELYKKAIDNLENLYLFIRGLINGEGISQCH